MVCVKIVRDRGPGRFFAFVDVSPANAALVAIQELAGTVVVDGCRLTLERAKPMGGMRKGLHEIIARLNESERERLLVFALALVAERNDGLPHAR